MKNVNIFSKGYSLNHVGKLLAGKLFQCIMFLYVHVLVAGYLCECVFYTIYFLAVMLVFMLIAHFYAH